VGIAGPPHHSRPPPARLPQSPRSAAGRAASAPPDSSRRGFTTARRPGCGSTSSLPAPGHPHRTLIAGGLLLLFVLSLIGGWIQISFTCPAVTPTAQGSTVSTAGGLWQGFGLLRLTVVLALGWFVSSSPRAGAGRHVPDSPRWRSPWMGVGG